MRTILPAPTRRARAVRAVTLVALSVGYLDLVRGGLTIAALVLVIGYLVLVPVVLLHD